MDQRRMSLIEQAVYRKHTNSHSYNGDRDVTENPSLIQLQQASKQATRTRPTVVPKQLTRQTPTFRFLVDPTHKTSQALVER